MSKLNELIYLREPQWKALVDLLTTLHHDVGLFDTPNAGAPVVLYQREGEDEGKLIVASEGAFAGEFRVGEDGGIEYPADWDD